MSHTYPPPEGLGPVLAKGKNQKGFSLVGALTASVIGLMVTYGITHNLVQTKLYQLSIEKRERRRGLYSFVNNVLSNSQSCLNTLKGKALTGNSTDKSFEITALKDENDNNLMDLSKPNGVLDATTKKKLKNMGIDKFEKLEFRYKPAMPRAGQVVLISKTEVKGLHEKNNREIVWELSGIKVETKTNNGESSDQVTLCMDAVPLKVLCGTNANGTGHLNGGGFVQSTATVDSGAFVADTAVVCGNAKVKDNAKVFGDAKILGNAKIKGNALVYDNAEVKDATVQENAKVYNSAKVSGSNTLIEGSAEIYGMAVISGGTVKGSAKIYGNAKVYGTPEIKGTAEAYDIAEISGNAQVYGNARVYGNGKVNGISRVYDNAQVLGVGIVTDNAWVYDNAIVVSHGVEDNVRIYGNAFIEAYIDDDAHVSGDVATTFGISGNCRCTGTKPAGEPYKYMRRSCHGNADCECSFDPQPAYCN